MSKINRTIIIFAVVLVLIAVILGIIIVNVNKKDSAEDVFNTYISYLQNRRI